MRSRDFDARGGIPPGPLRPRARNRGLQNGRLGQGSRQTTGDQPRPNARGARQKRRLARTPYQPMGQRLLESPRCLGRSEVDAVPSRGRRDPRAAAQRIRPKPHRRSPASQRLGAALGRSGPAKSNRKRRRPRPSDHRQLDRQYRHSSRWKRRGDAQQFAPRSDQPIYPGNQRIPRKNPRARTNPGNRPVGSLHATPEPTSTDQRRG